MSGQRQAIIDAARTVLRAHGSFAVTLESVAAAAGVEAAEIEGLDTFVVSCPKCMNMFEDSVKSTGNEDSIKVRELIELVEECMRPEDEATPA